MEEAKVDKEVVKKKKGIYMLYFCMYFHIICTVHYKM